MKIKDRITIIETKLDVINEKLNLIIRKLENQKFNWQNDSNHWCKPKTVKIDEEFYCLDYT